MTVRVVVVVVDVAAVDRASLLLVRESSSLTGSHTATQVWIYSSHVRHLMDATKHHTIITAVTFSGTCTLMFVISAPALMRSTPRVGKLISTFKF